MIEQLFVKGSSFSAFPLKVLYAFVGPTPDPLKAGVTTSSRHFKKAVDRNRIKRVVRETYRLQKPALMIALAEQNKSLALFFIYTGKELPVYTEVYDKMRVLLQKLETLASKEEVQP